MRVVGRNVKYRPAFLPMSAKALVVRSPVYQIFIEISHRVRRRSGLCEMVGVRVVNSDDR